MTINARASFGAFFLLSLSVGAADAQSIETRGAYCNDKVFGSDGAGISGCMNYALNYDTHTFGIGLVGVTPEHQGNVKTDPLDSLARLTGWYGREFESGDYHYAINGRVGIEGGAADDLALSIHDALHDLAGIGIKTIDSTKDTTFIGGVSGWVRNDFALGDSGEWAGFLSPYGHAALGNDVIEAGGGLMLSLQPSGADERLALLTPLNGAYAPTFGGDGIGLFAGVRGVVIETLYDDLANHFIAEAGITAQATFWEFAVIGASASCTTEPYDGADRPDCKATLQMGGLF